MPGYSGTPLPKKLGIKPAMRLCTVNEPHDLAAALGPLDDIKRVSTRCGALDLVLLFCRSYAELERHFAPLASKLQPAGMLWVGWPKKASGIASDLGEDRVREHGLACGLVDVKVCAITDIWSGLKFVIRVKDRWK